MLNGSRFFVTDSYNGTTRVYRQASATGIDHLERDRETPAEFAFVQCYPNPFNPTTVVSRQLPAPSPERSRGVEGPVASNVELKVYDVSGREVATLFNGVKQAGTHRVEFNGSGLASGIYLCRLVAGNFVQVRKMVLAK